MDVVLDDDAHRQEVRIASSRVRIPWRYMSSAVSTVEVAGASLAVSGAFDAVRTRLLFEEALEVVGATGRGRSEERGDEHGREGARRLQATTFINLSTSALRSTCCRRAWPRCTRSFGLPETKSKPRTMPSETCDATALALKMSAPEKAAAIAVTSPSEKPGVR